MWFALLRFATGLAAAGGDLKQEAEALMNFDFAEVEGRLERSKAAPAPIAAAPSQSYDEYGEVQYVPPPPVAALPLEPNSTLRTVTVHRDRAIVTRFRELDLGAGPHTVTFEGLPLAMSADGLAASVEAGTARIVSVETLSGVREVADTERIDAIRSDAEALVDSLGEVRDRIEALLAEREYLRSALVPTAATASQPVATVRTGLAFVAETERQIARELREQQDAGEKLAEKLQPLLVKLDDPLATGLPVRVDVEVERAGTVRVALRYTVPGAGWAPAYSARLDPTASTVELEVFGVVSQTTGEDWLDAEIALSTADPTGRGSVQALVPWTLGRSGGVGVYGALDLGTGATTGAPPAGDVAPVDARIDAAVENRGAVVLAIEGKRTIRGDGSPQRLPVAVQTLKAAVTLASVPKVAPEVQRRASMRYDGALPLLPGPASSFVGRDYVGSGAIEAVVPGEQLELGFGTDDRFRVTRQLVTRNQERVGRKASRYTFLFRTTVVNHGAAAATVELTDQVPLSEDDRIEVRVVESSGGVARDGGAIGWTLTVPPHADAHVDLSFTVTVPDELSSIAQDLQLML
ncbi:MAG: mucoidy inhibitor MuiA family protein [Myxococcota bacterium]